MNNKPYLLYMNENPSLMSKMVNRFRMKYNLTDIHKVRELTEEKLRAPVPEGLIMEEVDEAGLKGFFLHPGEDREEGCVLYLHGGGFCFGSGPYMRLNGMKFAEAFGVRTFALDYRLAPEHPFPAALDDAVRGYTYLLEQGYAGSRIVVVGDSAGGGLAFSLVHTLRQMDLELPKAIVAISPWTDLSLQGESHDLNKEKDIVFGMDRSTQVLKEFASAYAKADEFMDPLVSPRYGDFHGFPPILIIVGENEILLSDSVDLAEKAFQQGARIELQVWHQMYHDFPILPPLDRTLPEAKRAMRYITHFVERHLCGQSESGC